MRPTILILTLILTYFESLAQQDTVFLKYDKTWSEDTITYVTDTMIFESGMRRHILMGTTLLPWTGNQLIAKGYGVDFMKVTKSDCQNIGEIENHINSILKTDSTLTIDININDNCCYDFLCDITVDSNGTLNLIYTGYGTYCFCSCCFGLTYHLNVIKSEHFPEIKAVMINYDLSTLKPIDTK